LQTNGTPLAGVVNYEGDVDTFLVTVGAGAVLELSTPLVFGAGQQPAFVPVLYTAAGQQVFQLHNGVASDGANWLMAYSGLAAGTYEVRMTPNNDATGAYTVSARLGTDDFVNTAGGPVQSLGYGGRVVGRLDYGGDVDVFGMNLISTGTSYRFAVTPVDGSFVAPQLGFYTPGGQRLGITNTPASPDPINLTPGALPSGLVYVEVGANLAAGQGIDVVGSWSLDVYYRLTNGNDRLSASQVADFIEGQNGNDTIIGLGGNDRLFGGNGVDTLSGGLGNDYLYGGSGSDKLHGGSGNDIFVVGNSDGVDIISDFDSVRDTLQILGVTGVTSFAGLSMRQDGADVLITFSNGGSVRLVGIDIERIGPGNVEFLPPPEAAPTAGAATSAPAVDMNAGEFADAGGLPDHFDFAAAIQPDWHLA
jgi:Ca2+-binding RTX toxin-like protein